MAEPLDTQDVEWYARLHDLNASVRTEAKSLEIDANDDEQLTDLAGTLNALTSHLGSQKRGMLAEVEGGRYGRLWQFTQGRQYKRSYNTELLLNRIATILDWSLVAVIVHLMRRDVIRITWQYKKLMTLARELDMPITTVAHEIESGDPEADIGEVEGWASASWKYREENE